jgi:four helix bundle protein
MHEALGVVARKVEELARVACEFSFRRGERKTHMLDKAVLPHHKLRAFGVATELLLAVKKADVRETHLRDQAMRAAQSACLNTAEGAARVTRADKARAFAIARAECVEAAAAIEIAALCGTAKQADSDAVAIVADRLVAMLTRLIR